MTTPNTETLFDIPEQKSPRLLWIEKHGVKIAHYPEFDGTQEDDMGETMYPYFAWTGTPSIATSGSGMTADDALTDWARKNHVKLWNEELL